MARQYGWRLSTGLSIEDIEETVVTATDHVPIYVRDLAREMDEQLGSDRELIDLLAR